VKIQKKKKFFTTAKLLKNLKLKKEVFTQFFSFFENYRKFVLLLSGFSLGLRRKRCKILLQLSDSNCVTLAVELRVYRWRRGGFVVVVVVVVVDAMTFLFLNVFLYYTRFSLFFKNKKKSLL
jgi:hypothetical protein